MRPGRSSRSSRGAGDRLSGRRLVIEQSVEALVGQDVLAIAWIAESGAVATPTPMPWPEPGPRVADAHIHEPGGSGADARALLKVILILGSAACCLGLTFCARLSGHAQRDGGAGRGREIDRRRAQCPRPEKRYALVPLPEVAPVAAGSRCGSNLGPPEGLRRHAAGAGAAAGDSDATVNALAGPMPR